MNPNEDHRISVVLVISFVWGIVSYAIGLTIAAFLTIHYLM